MIIKANTEDYYKTIKFIRSYNRKVIFFNGCFDILHLGHIKLFNYVNSLADQLSASVVVGINSDASVKMQNKSHGLVHNEEYRAEMIEQFFLKRQVNIIAYDTFTPSSIIWHLMPDIIVKGNEYEKKEFAEKTIMNMIGGGIVYFDSKIDMSTTKIIEKVKSFDTV